MRPLSFSSVFSALFLFLLSFFLYGRVVQAATCTISSDTVITQAYVTSNSCTAIEIDGTVSTTWNGVVDLSGGTVTVKAGSVMTMGSSSQMILGTMDDFVIEAGATTTHTGEDPNGLKITARNITITGALSASEKGCRRAALNGADGYGVDVATGFCGFQTGGYGRGGDGSGEGGGGGSYAGRGGGGGPSRAGGAVVYGNSLLPNFLGSGGGTGYYTTAFGGAGGGLIHVTSTGTLTVNGAITARGAAGGYDGVFNGGGGGAGGSILIHAGALAGGGSISVSGGAGGAGGGGGSAGRVAVFYGSSSFSLSNITAAAGQGGAGGAAGDGVSGAAGTTYFLNRYVDDGAGTVTITNTFDFPSGGDYARDAFVISSGVSLGCSTSTAALTVSSTAWLSLDNVTWACTASIPEITLASNAGLSTTNTVMTFTAATSVNLIAPAWTNVTTTFVLSKSGARSTWDISSALTLRNLAFATLDAGVVDASGGFLFLPRSIPLTLVSSTIAASVSSTSLTALSIDAQSNINASSRGCPRSRGAVDGYGPNVMTGICGQSVGGYGAGGGGSGDSGAGAAHAGVGGNGSVGLGAGVLGSTATYGSSTEPVLYGSSGGGGYFTNTGAGGGAGGVIHLTVSGTLTVDGAIRADGGQGVYSGAWAGGGGGAGGSVNLRVGSLAGSGSISANGGRGADGGTGAGGGGGGRIALRYSGLSFSGTSSTTLGAAGTGGASPGGAGTIYTLQLNTAPSVPASLGPTALVNGSTTGTANPLFTFSLSDPDVADAVRYRIQIDDTADFSSPVVDYTSALAAQGGASFQVGQAQGSGTYTVGTNDQTLSNGSYYWRVKTIDPNAVESSYTTANSGAIAFIVDSTPHYLSFQSSTGSGIESVTATSIRILLNTEHFEDVTVNYAVTAGTAEGAGVDYTLTSGVATITAGQTSTTIALTVVDDSIDEPDETLTVTLSSPAYAIIGSNTSTVYTITDNDTGAVTFSQSSLSLSEGASDSYTVVLSTAPTTTVQVLLSAGSGLSLSTSTIAFTESNYSTPVTVTVTAVNDTVYTGNRSVSILHTASTTAGGYSALSLSSVAVSITEDEVQTQNTGGGAVGAGGAGGAVTPIAFLVGVPTTPVIPRPVSEPIIIIVPDLPPPTTTPTPPTNETTIPEIVSILNPSDILSLVRATQGSRDFEREGRVMTNVIRDLKEMKVSATEADKLSLSNFITYGISERTFALGEGERRALVRDALETMKTAKISPMDLERLARGMIPQFRNLAAERAQVKRAQTTFKTIYGHDPDFKNPAENLAWNTLMYRIRFPRDLNAEREGIQSFRELFRRAPQDPFQWAVVRVLGYVR